MIVSFSTTLLAGIHPIREALRAGVPLEKIVIAKGAGGARIQEIITLARERSVVVQYAPREHLDREAQKTPHQGAIAFGAAGKYAQLDTTAATKGLHVILDGVEDPHNLGAIIRTAHAAGAAAVVIAERRAAGMTDTVARTSAGATSYLPVVRVTNIKTALEDLKKQGYWIYGLDERGKEDYDKVALTAPTAFVFGAEGHGLHEHVAKHCDFLVRIPMAGAQGSGPGVASLNVSVAAGVMLFEWKRRGGG